MQRNQEYSHMLVTLMVVHFIYQIYLFDRLREFKHVQQLARQFFSTLRNKGGNYICQLAYMCLNSLKPFLNENIEKKIVFFFYSQVTHKQYIYKQVYQISDTYMTNHCRCLQRNSIEKHSSWCCLTPFHKLEFKICFSF